MLRKNLPSVLQPLCCLESKMKQHIMRGKKACFVLLVQTSGNYFMNHRKGSYYKDNMTPPFSFSNLQSLFPDVPGESVLDS